MKKRFLAALCVATVFLPLASTISSAGTIKCAVDDDVRYIASTVSSVVHALTLSWFSRQ